MSGPRLTVGAQLERDRLQHRATRLHAVIAALRRRADEERAEGARRAPGLAIALDDFERELDAVRSQLHPRDAHAH